MSIVLSSAGPPTSGGIPSLRWRPSRSRRSLADSEATCHDPEMPDTAIAVVSEKLLLTVP